MGIQAIGDADVHKITAGQVIIDLRSAIKELLENSLDAKADKIDIVFKNYGIESIECTDNGVGIAEDDLDSIGLKHRTSKISSFEDVSRVTSFGFRGEAIASLCQMGNVVITTTTKGPKAYKLIFSHVGRQSKTVCSRNTGTSVLISNLFDTLPVRKKDFVKNHRRQFSRSVELIQSYAIIQTQVKISVSNVLPSGRKTLVLSSTGKSDITRNLVSVFGSNAGKGLISIDKDLDLSNIRYTSIVPESQQTEILPKFSIEVHGLISMISFGCGRASKDRQYIYINSRPVDYPKVAKTINETYQSFNNIQYPSFVLDFQVSTMFLDLNVTPDKRTVSLHHEEYVLDALKETLQIFFQQQGFVVPKSETPAKGPFGTKRIKLEQYDLSPSQQEDSYRISSVSPSSKRSTIIKCESLESPKIISSTNTQDSLEIDGTKAGYEYESAAREENDSKNEMNIVDSEPGETSKSASREEEQMYHSELSDSLSANNDVSIQSASLCSTDHTSKTSNLFVESESDNEIDCHPKTSISDLSDPKVTATDSKEPYLASKKSKVCLENFLHRKSSDVELEQSPIEVDELVVKIDNSITTIPASQDRNNKLVLHPQHNTDKKNDHSCDSCHSHSSDGSISSEDDFDDVENSVSKDEFHSNYNEEEIRVNKQDAILTGVSAHEISNLVTEFRRSLESEIEKSENVVSSIGINNATKHERLVNEIASIEDREKAETLLTLTVSKNDFKNMNVVGQFNLGFIIVTRRKEGAFDLFIIDQHASDEKFNFEMLQKSTVFKSQSLLLPKTMELSIIDELLVMEFEDVFVKNGFKLSISQEEEPGKRVKLMSFPVSKNTMFTEYDFHELIQLIREHEGHNMSKIRCSKIRSMFAMRACRSSIMIGKPLSMRKMKKVVQNLSELDKPWNCPHGRPTLRHLMELRDWDPFYDDYMV
ncbi:unnamed protein product [Kluyveromyces dobzhanskii CBS 2104]|uniref:WGS project CCBQ000000000 data, contig 00099 n=1 Tax=Kluyveromyces dobzhanskii CBS 2104 TaxID=1427455 RepID=A0A0A8L4Y8_9SACH|nr:unnamed protein product [Kluyveromyces dobzhanskii CBS 2104]